MNAEWTPAADFHGEPGALTTVWATRDGATPALVVATIGAEGEITALDGAPLTAMIVMWSGDCPALPQGEPALPSGSESGE